MKEKWKLIMQQRFWENTSSTNSHWPTETLCLCSQCDTCIGSFKSLQFPTVETAVTEADHAWTTEMEETLQDCKGRKCNERFEQNCLFHALQNRVWAEERWGQVDSLSQLLGTERHWRLRRESVEGAVCVEGRGQS